jgi:D-alanyl-D-alanine carboxypeptidase (penicillin-binding protein 5/6)
LIQSLALGGTFAANSIAGLGLTISTWKIATLGVVVAATAGALTLSAHNNGLLGGDGKGPVEVHLAPPLPAPVATTNAIAAPAQGADPLPPAAVDAASEALLVDLGSGRTLYARNADRPFLPASVTKTMTAFVAFEMLAKGELRADQPITVSHAAWKEWHAKGSRMFLADGSTPTVDDLLMGIMNVSANDGAVVLAEGAAGSVPAWVAKMNDAAHRLGMTQSHFGTPNGWMDEGVTHVSARDLVKLADAMITRYPEYYKRYVGRHGMRWNGITQPNHDPTLGLVPGADGIKTGFTNEAHYNFLGSAQRGGRRLVMVLAGVPLPRERSAAAKALLEWGFSQWDARPFVAGGARLGEARVQGGKVETLPLVAPRDFFVTLPKGAVAPPTAMRIVYNGPLVAPIAKGTPVAELEVRVGDAPPAHLPLMAGESVSKGGVMDRLRFGFARLIS